MNLRTKLRLLWRFYGTQQKLANELPWYVTQPKISHWVNGRQNIPLYVTKQVDELFLACAPRMLTHPRFAQERWEITAHGLELQAKINDEVRAENSKLRDQVRMLMDRSHSAA